MSEGLKRCGRCRAELPTTSFYMRQGKPDTAWCKDCYRRWHRDRYEPRVHVEDTFTCESCGDTFPLKQRKPTRYCSQRCRNQARISARREQRITELLGRTCAHCGTAIPEAADSRRRFCDNLCASRARATRRQPGERSAYNMKRLYGITPEQRDALLNRQDGCAICHSWEPGAKGWAVDHDHGCCPTDRSCGDCVRGILCQRCNMGIGLLNDDPERLRTAARYVTRTRRRT